MFAYIQRCRNDVRAREEEKYFGIGKSVCPKTSAVEFRLIVFPPPDDFATLEPRWLPFLILYHSWGSLSSPFVKQENSLHGEEYRNTGCIKKKATTINILKLLMFLSTINFRCLGIQNGSNRIVELLIVILVTFICTPDFI